MITFVDFLLQEEYIALVLDDQTRAKLIKHFPPKFKDFIGHHITMEFGVSKNTELPDQPRDIKVVGYASDDSLEALVVSVDGKIKRPDGSIYHITWSLDRSKGRKPKDSNQLLTKGYKKIDNPININANIQLLR